MDSQLRDVGEQVRLWRNHKGLTQSSLERAAGLAHNAVSRIERGEVQSPRIETLERLAEVMGISLDQLYLQEPPQNGASGSSDAMQRLIERLRGLPQDQQLRLIAAFEQIIDLVDTTP